MDTANVYGGWHGTDAGATESILGTWFASGGGRRESTVLATKVYQTMGGQGPNDRGVSAYAIRRECEASLRRLQTDHIDLYQLHHIDRAAPWDEVWQAMEVLVAQGKVLYVGSSNFAGWHIAQANEVARSRHALGLISEQSLYNLTERTVELEVLPACQDYGVGVLPWSPLAGGLLGGVLAKEGLGRRAHPPVSTQLALLRPQIEAYEQLCRELQVPPAELALAWLLAQPAVAAPIIGPRTPQQLNSVLGATDRPMSPQTLHAWTRSSPDQAVRPRRRTPGNQHRPDRARPSTQGRRRARVPQS